MSKPDQQYIPPTRLVGVQRRIALVQERLVAYLAAGCPSSGFNDAMMLKVEMIQLRDLLTELLDEKFVDTRKTQQELVDQAQELNMGYD